MARQHILGVAAALLVLFLAGPALAQEAPYRQGSVWDLTFVRTKPGMTDDYLKGLATNWKAEMEEAKKEGLVLSYRILSANSADRNDWDLMLMIEYKNWAAFDGLDEKFRALDAKIIGTEDQQRDIMVKRLDIREILGGKSAQELILK
jgi:hypothetical protein